MSDLDPIQRLEELGDTPARPSSGFSDELLERLLIDLDDDPARPVGDPVAKKSDGGAHEVTLQREGNEMGTPKRRLAMALAAAVVLIAGLIGITQLGDDDSDNVITDSPTTTESGLETTTTSEGSAPSTTAVVVDTSTPAETSTTTEQPAPPTTLRPVPPTPTGVNYETAMQLLDAVGGPDGLRLATIETDHPWNAVTFDPNNNDRFLAADLRYTTVEPPRLWEIGDGAAIEQAMPWVGERSTATRGGLFQRDGSIVMEPADPGTVRFPVFDGTGEFLHRVRTDPFPSLVEVEGERVISLTTPLGRCPFRSVVVGDLDMTEDVDDQPNGFARVMIPEPGVGVALPFFPDDASCDETSSLVARAWDLQTLAPIPDHPLDGLEVARAAISSDGSRIAVLRPNGTVQVLGRDQQVVADLANDVSAGHTLTPMALNANGSIAVVSEDSGRASVWHVDSAQLLFEITSNTRTMADSTAIDDDGGTANNGHLYVMGGTPSYDATRLAILDTSASDLGSLSVLTLDPNEWLARACSTGFTLDAESLAEQGFDPSIDC